jgi:2,3-bisphosphoglycerate-independent phosphoglycerate mutase
VLNESKEVELPLPRLKNIYFVAMTNFGPDLPVHTAFQDHPLNGTLPTALKNSNQLYIAETEKFAHITYFLNGGYADAIDGEDRLMVPSPIVDSYAKKPEMAAREITEKILRSIRKNKYNFIAVNFANADMVGHTGEMKATIRAVEIVDNCLANIYKEVDKLNGSFIVTADHGNADCMWDKYTNLPMTFHTKNPVPLIISDKRLAGKRMKLNGVLGNVAPTLCEIMGVEKLKEMKMESLI